MMKRRNWIKCVVAASLFLTATSCKKETGSTPEQEFVDNFKALVMGSKEIDSHQDWNTVGNANINITVDFGVEADYTVYISQTPLIFDSDAVYIGMAKVKSGESKTITIPRPANAALLYAACFDAEGHAISKPFSVMDGTTDISFTGKSPVDVYTYKPTTGNNWSVPVPELPDLSPYTSGTLVNPTDEVELDDEHDVHFVINSDYIGFIPSLGTFSKKSVYVTATWTLTFNQQVLRDNVLIVGAGGKIMVSKDFKLTNSPVDDEGSGQVYVLPGGEITGEGVLEFVTSSGTYIYNGGTITAKNINLNDAILFNAGTIGKSDGTETKINCTANSTNPCVLANTGNAYLAEITGENFAIENAGYLKVNSELKLSDASKMDDGSITECNTLTLNGDANGEKILYMGNAAFMNCLGDISIDNFGMQGPSGSSFKANAVLKVNKCAYCATTDGVAGTYLLDHVELILPDNFPTIFDNGAINVYDGEMKGIGMGKLVTTFSGYYDLYMLYYWLNGYEGRLLNTSNYEWSLSTGKYAFLWKNGVNPCSANVDPSNQTCFYSTSPSYTSGTDANFRKKATGSAPSNGYIFYIFETLESNSKDFDYNDVVLRVNVPFDNGDGTYTSNVQIMCVGNTVKTNVLYQGEPFGEEIHAAMGIDVKAIINTKDVIRGFRKMGEITFNSSNMNIDKLDFSLQTENTAGQLIVESQPSSQGSAPLYLVVNGDNYGKWKWAAEGVNIGIAYPQFSDWASNLQTNTDWYCNSNSSGSVISY